MFFNTERTRLWSFYYFLSIILVAQGSLNSSTFAAGFGLPEQNASGLGNAFAGAAAIAEDASTLFFNPAGLTRLSQQHLVLAGRLYIPSHQFFNEGSSINASLPLTGDNGGDSDSLIALPNVYYAYSHSPHLKFGLGITTPIGSTITYNNDWIGRYHLIKHETLSTSISPSVAYKFTDQLSLGASINIQYTQSTLSHALFLGTKAQDSVATVKQNDWGVGYSIGLLYEVTPNTRLGVNFRSKVNHSLTGTAHYTGIPGSNQADAQTPITLPNTVSLSGFHQINDRWAVMADVTWTQWSCWQSLDTKLTFPHNYTSNIVQPLNWHDSWRYAVGVTFQPHHRWKLRAGLAYDSNIIPDSTRAADMLQADQIGLAAGLGYQLNKTTTLDFGYTHQFINQAHIKNAQSLFPPLKATLQGYYETSLDVLGMQLSFQF